MKFWKLMWFVTTQMSRFKYGKLGSKSYLGPVTFVQSYRNLELGSNVRIYPGLRAEMTEVNSKLIFRGNNSVGQNFHAVSGKRPLIIGKGTTISGNVFISNVDHSYQEYGVPALDQKLLYQETRVGDNCFIGYGAVILPGSSLGDNCIVGANSVVKGHYESGSVIAGVPAKMIRQYKKSTDVWEKV